MNPFVVNFENISDNIYIINYFSGKYRSMEYFLWFIIYQFIHKHITKRI